MSVQSIWQQFYQNVVETKWQEWVSTLAQVLSVWYAKKNKIWVYPTGIIGVLLAAYVYYFMASPPLYADGLLNVYYFVMSVYGWYAWNQKSNHVHTYPISWCNKKEIRMGILLFIMGWLILFILLSKITDSNTPILDALVSASAVTSMWWMAKRKIENWIAWIFSNLVAIPLNFYKGFMLFTLMYILFLLLAVSGYQEWKKQIKPMQVK